MNKYPVVKLLMRHGNLFAIAVSLCVVAMASVFAISISEPFWILGAVLTGFVVYVLLKSYVELVEILSDMLMPQ